jgi:hypothetical protein
MTRKSIKYSFFLIIVVLAGSLLFAYREYNRKRSDTADLTARYILSGNELIKAFTSDEKAANAKYLDKIIALNGIVKSVDQDEQGAFTVIVGDSASMSSVRCSMDSSHNAEAEGLKAGFSLTLKGICTGFNSDELLGSDVLMNRCSVSKQ